MNKGRFFIKNIKETMIEAPSSEEIREYQLQKLQQYQRLALKKTTSELNEFLLSNNEHFISQGQNLSIKKAWENIQKNIYDIYTNDKKILKKEEFSEEEEKKLKNLATALKNIDSALKNVKETYKSSDIQRFQEEIEKININMPNAKSISSAINWLYRMQGDFLEETGTDFLATKFEEIFKNLRVINTGSLFRFENEKKQRIIQDMLVIELTDNNKDQKIKFTYNNNNKVTELSLEQFLTQLSNNKISTTITIDEASFKNIINFSKAAIQAKSGINQLPWNTKSKNTWINFKNPKPLGNEKSLLYYNYFSSYVDFIEKNKDNQKYFLALHPDYDAFGNYIIGHHLYKILHLSQKDQQYVLTRNGFMTFEQRIHELYTNKTSYPFIFAKRVRLNSTVLIQQRQVILNKK